MLSVGGPVRLTPPVRMTPAGWLDELPKIVAKAAGISDLEDALSVLTTSARRCLGDATAATRTGALKLGERDYRVSGIFLIAPDRRHNVLVANDGFPPEQRRLSIPLSWNHPGQVVATERPLLLRNTDEHEDFRQFLKTSKMGSSLYMPIVAGGVMIGQIVAAAQARWTYSEEDISPMAALASIAALIWEERDGYSWWEADHPAADAWYAENMEAAQT